MIATVTENRLAVPLVPERIAAANRLHGQLLLWQRTDRALAGLKAAVPGFTPEATLLKAVAINSLYKTQIIAIERVADHVSRVLTESAAIDAGPDLVERLANVPRGGTEKKPKHRYSFAAKFAHFFIDEERFPILDGFAEKVVAYHLGKKLIVTYPNARYRSFVENLRTFLELARLTCQGRELDRYLWLAGQYRAWLRKPNGNINGECRALFGLGSPDLAVMWPAMR